MVTAIGCYYDCITKASRARVLATKAARLGRQERAIKLTSAAQRYDQAAEGWHKVVPEWQWEANRTITEWENS